MKNEKAPIYIFFDPTLNSEDEEIKKDRAKITDLFAKFGFAQNSSTNIVAIFNDPRSMFDYFSALIAYAKEILLPPNVFARLLIAKQIDENGEVLSHINIKDVMKISFLVDIHNSFQKKKMDDFMIALNGEELSSANNIAYCLTKAIIADKRDDLTGYHDPQNNLEFLTFLANELCKYKNYKKFIEGSDLVELYVKKTSMQPSKELMQIMENVCSKKSKKHHIDILENIAFSTL